MKIINILGFIFSIISTNSRIFEDYPFMSRLAQPAAAYIFIFAMYGAYVGYVFKDREHLSVLGAVAGVLSGIALAGYTEWAGAGGETNQLAFYPIILAAAGLVFGLPRIRNMVVLAIFGALGGAAGYGIYLLGLNLEFYLVFLDNDGSVLEMYKKPAISGTAASAIINTEHGKALKISGDGRIELTMEQKHVRFIKGNSQDFFDELKLSMSSYSRTEAVKGSQIEAWVYSESDGAALNYQIKQDSGGGRIMDIHTEERLNQGWQKVKLSVTNIMYD